MGPLLSGDGISVVVDYYSRYFEVGVVKSIVSSKIIASLQRYRSTDHSTTGVSPAEVLFKRKIRTELPEFDSSCFDDLQFARDHDPGE